MQKFRASHLATVAIFSVVLLISVFLRMYVIHERPLHNDEGVNYFFVKSIFADGFFKYSHENYHGPSYFYLLALSTYLFGISEFSQRFASAVPSFILIIACFFCFTYVRYSSRIFTSLLLALSTTFLYYSRYSIHETLLVLSCMLGVHYAFQVMILKKDRYIVYFLLSVALAISTKETFIIHLASLVFAHTLVFPLRKSVSYIRNSSASVSWGVFFSLLLIFILFSGFFQSVEGLRELFMGVPQWLGRGHSDTGHHKPYWYYFRIMKLLEPVSLLGLIPILEFLVIFFKRAGAQLTFVSRKYGLCSKEGFFSLIEFPSTCIDMIEKKAACMFSFYGIASFLAYSYVPYKTPWLIINITVPLLIAFGIWLPLTLKHPIIQKVCMCAIICFSASYSLKYNFSGESLGVFSPYVQAVGVTSELNPLSYVHTQQGMVTVSEEIADYVSKKRGTRILIAISSYWPLPYYLRNFESQLMYSQGVDPINYFKEYDIILADKDKKRTHEGWTSKEIRLSDNQESLVYFKNIVPQP